MAYDALIRERTARALHVLVKFDTADLAALGQLGDDLERAMPWVLNETDGPPVCVVNRGMFYTSIEVISALAAATSKGLGLITPLFDSTSSSTCLPQHADALRCKIFCSSMYGGMMNSYLHYGNGLMRLEPDAAMERKALQLAVTAKSTAAVRSSSNARCRS
jgi:hypothetical protein